MSARQRRVSGRRRAPVRSGRAVYAVDVALDARLFGRFRLLSIDAAIDVTEPSEERVRHPDPATSRRRAREQRRPGHRATSADRRSNGVSSGRRIDVVTLLGEAERHLRTEPGGSAGDG